VQPLLEQAKGLLGDAIALRRRIHASPELGLDLPETQRAVLEAIEPLGLEVRTSTSTSGVVATLRGARPGPVLLLRADMDALPMREDADVEFASRNPGAMHACGHDSHVAMLAGAARLLAERREQLAGTAKFVFQPGEEGHFGALRMIEEGLLDDPPAVEAAFAVHIDPRLPVGRVAGRPGPMLASADVLSIEVRGRGGHASMPHDANDPIPVACEMVQALQTLVTRRIKAFEPVVLTIAKIEAGTTVNVIPESAVLGGTLRSVSERSRRQAQEGIRRVISGIAAAHEVEAEVQIFEGYPVTVNHARFVDLAREVATAQLGDGAFVEMPSPIMGAEDFSYILDRVPGAMVFVGVRPDGVELPSPCHSNRMVLNEEGMVAGIALHAGIALRYLDAAPGGSG
jgi:amidohydrolase